MRSSTVVSARVPNELAGAFELSAEINGVTVSTALREAVRAYVAATANETSRPQEDGSLLPNSIDHPPQRKEARVGG